MTLVIKKYYVQFAFLLVQYLLKTIRESNRLNPDQDQHSVGPSLGPNCLQRLLSAGEESWC